MIYKRFADLNLSALGMGCMRLPTTAEGKIDEDRTAEMLAYAMERGVNYYDTAYGYHGGQSELVMGKLLQKYPRESFFLASKFPGYDLRNMGKAKEIFAEQLRKCRVEYFDFYLVHSVSDQNLEGYLDPEGKFGDVAYLIELRKQGKIRHLGFSAHVDIPGMRRFLEKYGKEMEFCQIQLNYLDWTFQDARGKVDLLREFGLPIWVMEPVRGGALATLDETYAEKLRALRPDETIPAWAFRFIQSIPDVVVTLSGMSNDEQLRQNIATFSEEKPLDRDEWNTLLDLADEMTKRTTLPCTGCRYCVDHCPQGLKIPETIKLYNDYRFTGGGAVFPGTIRALSGDQSPANCVGCRSCESVCPQNIAVSEMMKIFAERIENSK